MPQIWSQSLSFLALNFSCVSIVSTYHHPQEPPDNFTLKSSISISKKVIQNVQSWKAKKFQRLGTLKETLVLNTSKNCLVDPFLLQREKHQPPNQNVEFQEFFWNSSKIIVNCKKKHVSLEKTKIYPNKKSVGWLITLEQGALEIRAPKGGVTGCLYQEWPAPRAFTQCRVDQPLIDRLLMIEHLFIFSSYVFHFEWFKML
jgi:hypothetical protein